MPTYIARTTIYDRIDAQLQTSYPIASISPKKTPSVVFEEFSRVYERASFTQTPKNTRETLISLGKEIETSPEFALLGTAVQQTYLVALDHLQERDNPLRSLITKCRILLRSLIYWATGLPENRRMHILDALKKASDCLDSKDSLTEDEARKLYIELRDAQEKISLLSTFPFQKIENLLADLNTVVSEIRSRSAYERLKQEYESIKPINREITQEELQLIPSLTELQDNPSLTKKTLAMFKRRKPILKLHFTKQFLPCAQQEEGYRPLAQKLFNHTLRAFNDRSPQEQAAVKEFLNESLHQSRIEG